MQTSEPISMIYWKTCPPPDGPKGKTVLNSWIGTNLRGEKLYLCEMLSSEEAVTERYATLGVLGRFPSEDEIEDAKRQLCFPDAHHLIPAGAFGVRIDIV